MGRGVAFVTTTGISMMPSLSATCWALPQQSELTASELYTAMSCIDIVIIIVINKVNIIFPGSFHAMV